MQYGTAIDWLSYTIHWEHLQADNWVIMTDAHESASFVLSVPNAWDIEKGLHGYRYTLVNRRVEGLRVMVSSPDSAMGVHVQYSGRALGALDIEFVLQNCLEWHGKPSRVDLAIDVFGCVTIDDIVAAWEMGAQVTRAKQYAHIKSGTGETFYVGARTSDRYLRIYDKGAQLGTGEDWTRIEIECKREMAIMAFHAYRLYEGKAAREKIQSFCDFPTVEWWTDAMNSYDTVESEPRKEKIRNTRKWLMESVAPAFAREMLRDTDFQEAFMDEVRRRIQSGWGLL
jgi:hypothetical protein